MHWLPSDPPLWGVALLFLAVICVTAGSGPWSVPAFPRSSVMSGARSSALLQSGGDPPDQSFHSPLIAAQRQPPAQHCCQDHQTKIPDSHRSGTGGPLHDSIQLFHGWGEGELLVMTMHQPITALPLVTWQQMVMLVHQTYNDSAMCTSGPTHLPCPHSSVPTWSMFPLTTNSKVKQGVL